MSMKSNVEYLEIPYKQLAVPDEQNIRNDLPKIKELAESIATAGQLEAITVTNGGEGEKPYTVRRGFRRMAAFKLLAESDDTKAKWGNAKILCQVESEKKGNVVERIVKNWVANTQREDFHPLDQGEFIHKLLEGTYSVDEGEKAKKLTREEISTEFGMTKSHLGKLLKLFVDIDPDVAKAARKAQAPLRLLIAISHLDHKDPEKRHEIQAARLEEWISEQEQLAKTGRKRSVRADKGKKKGEKDAEPVGILKDSKRVSHAQYQEKLEDGDGNVTERGYTVADYLTVLTNKQQTLAAEKSKEAREDALRFEGMVQLIRFQKGEIKKLPGIVVADFDVLNVEEEAAEEEEEATE